ncbi:MULTISPECIES: hypothetical protein [unclassified Streptomyces]|uniref:hypothetical protein n=1 Tax=unclassified Streptomyces TaxID=2593676 RepID=UPI0027E3F3D7|nr:MULTISPECIES: hypothetical protein [unclassified Streptomyces]
MICLAREETASRLGDEGIRVHSRQFGDFHATVEADTMLREPVDLCLVTVKNTALDRLPPQSLANGVCCP